MYQFGIAEIFERKIIMKKILSAILSLTMILALVASMGITASAKDGDVLYEVNFKGDDKYAPADFCVLKGDGTLATEVSASASPAHSSPGTGAQERRRNWKMKRRCSR